MILKIETTEGCYFQSSCDNINVRECTKQETENLVAISFLQQALNNTDIVKVIDIYKDNSICQSFIIDINKVYLLDNFGQLIEEVN